MEAIKNQFIIPIIPSSSNAIEVVYPWENISLLNNIKKLYQIVIKTGYKGSFEQFQSQLGEILQREASLINPDEYIGNYTVTPLPIMSSILETEKNRNRKGALQ